MKIRKYIKISRQLADDPLLYCLAIEEGMQYSKGLKGKSYTKGLDGDDFVKDLITIVFNLIKVSRILNHYRNERKVRHLNRQVQTRKTLAKYRNNVV